MTDSSFVESHTKQPLREDVAGNLYCDLDGRRIVYSNHDGSYDFVHPDSENIADQEFYDQRYRTTRSERLTFERIRYHWSDDGRPENAILLKSLGNLSGKRVLLLGNGVSIMELYFLHLGAYVVYTDISLPAVKHVQDQLAASSLKELGSGNIEFHAVDGLHLPFADASFDIIYGAAFVHHVEDLEGFLSEVKRCLKDGGRCRFLDCAHSPIWELAKRTVLRPLKIYLEKKRGISPEDARAAERGGFTESQVADLMRKVGFRDAVFVRVSFFVRLTHRGLGKIFGWDVKVFERGRPLLVIARWMDSLFTRSRLGRNNLIALVWGFDK